MLVKIIGKILHFGEEDRLEIFNKQDKHTKVNKNTNQLLNIQIWLCLEMALDPEKVTGS